MSYNPAYNENVSNVLATSAGLDQATSFMHTWMVPIVVITVGIWILRIFIGFPNRGGDSSSSSSSYSTKKGGRVVDKSEREDRDRYTEPEEQEENNQEEIKPSPEDKREVYYEEIKKEPEPKSDWGVSNNGWK
jgi:cytoskeletal protein RodZ